MKVQELRTHISDFRVLVDGCATSPYSPTTQAQRRKVAGSKRARAKDVDVLEDIHSVLMESYRCECPRPHSANFCISNTYEMMFPLDSSEPLSRTRRGRSSTIDTTRTLIGVDLDESTTK